jgi:hypothetical protein
MLEALRDAPPATIERLPVKLFIGDAGRNRGACAIGRIYLIEELLEIRRQWAHVELNP